MNQKEIQTKVRIRYTSKKIVFAQSTVSKKFILLDVIQNIRGIMRYRAVTHKISFKQK